MSGESNSGVPSLQRTPRLVDGVVSQLRDSIIEGTLSAGTPLLQVALAEQLGVSRTPLREALRVLESEGLLRTSDRNRTVEVTPIGPEALRDMYQMREVIDGLAARLAASNRLSEEEAERARGFLDEMAQSSDPFNPARRNRAHSQFHELIAQASGNTKVQSFASLIRTSSAALYLPLTREATSRNVAALEPDKTWLEVLERAHVQHREILDCITSGDAEGAEAAARAHIRRTLRLAPHSFAAQDDPHRPDG